MFDKPRIRMGSIALMFCSVLGGSDSLLWAQSNRTRDSESGFAPLFNGRDFKGWEGNFNIWKIEDGMIVGDSPGIKQNEFLATREIYDDFELRLEFRLHRGVGNSGIQFRSKRLPGSSAIEGYQADIGESYWGCLYDEHRRRRVLVQASAGLAGVLKKNEWNSYTILANGNHVVLKVNGLITADYHEKDRSIPATGILALQVHSGPAMRVDFRNIRVKRLDRK